MEENKVGDDASQNDGKTEAHALRMRKLRWIAGVMLALSIFFYALGNENMKGQAIMGAIGAIIVFVFSFLAERRKEE
jgi:hypothetical protein